MKLLKSRIRNFRSISDIEIIFEPKCRVLVGINESGKSNILKALSLLGTQKSLPEDVRQPLPKEQEIEESYVRFMFLRENEDCIEIAEILKTEILTEDLIGLIKKYFVNGVYEVNILSGEKKVLAGEAVSENGIGGGWVKPTEKCPDNLEINIGKEKFSVKNYKAIESILVKDLAPEYFIDISVDEILPLFKDAVVKFISTHLPHVVLWTYSNKNLLPPQIKLADFSENPDICIPLKNLFNLAGIKSDQIKEKISNYQKLGYNRFQTFFNRIATHATEFFRDVWKEYQNISFSLIVNGENLVPGIKELNTYDFSARSDGFKRFIGFLLIVSVNVKTDLIKNSLLLIDEADMGLHPSGVEYLRNELIKISDKNIVVYSTHSIFMIDGRRIERHIKVKKNQEITKIEDVSESNLVDEEVLYNALGHSVFKLLKEKNLMFEGWKDKKLFMVALRSVPRRYEAVKILKKYGICHAHGVKSIKHITPLMEIAKRPCVIITDSDSPAREKQTEYITNQGYGLWKRYDEFEGQSGILTSEDYLKDDYYLECLKNVVSTNYESIALTTLTVPGGKTKLEGTRIVLTQQGLNGLEIKGVLTALKDKLYGSLTRTNIKEEYYEMLVGLVKLSSEYFNPS